MTILPPKPFSWITTARPGEHDGTGYVYVLDSRCRKIASLWGNRNEKVAMAEMIVAARAQVKP